MSPDAHTPAERADAVLRAAEAAAAAAAAAQAVSLPAPAEPAPAEPPPPPPEPEHAPPDPPVHEAGAPARLLAAAGELEAHVAQARAQLDALENALARVGRQDGPPD